MLQQAMRWSAACLGLFWGGAPLALRAVPPQVIPTTPESGAPVFALAGNTTGAGPAGGSSSAPYRGNWGGGSATTTLQAQSYGASAIAAAQAAGVNPDTLAAFAQIESHFSNVGNTTSSAEGVWQITNGTWSQYASQLGLSDGDRDDPTAQAKVASAIISDYASSVSRATGSAPSSAEVYGAYMFGPSAGSKLATANDQTQPLSNFVSAQALAANHMSTWTVGQYYATVSARMGSGAKAIATGSS